MVTAIVLLKVDRKRIHSVAEELADMPGITEAYSITGRFDLAVIARVRTNEELEELVTDRMLLVDGILDSETHFAFRVYSRHDLESMFSIGMEP
jgi:DNA-binding Lrp family transcriptional regulator